MYSAYCLKHTYTHIYIYTYIHLYIFNISYFKNFRYDFRVQILFRKFCHLNSTSQHTHYQSTHTRSEKQIHTHTSALALAYWLPDKFHFVCKSFKFFKPTRLLRSKLSLLHCLAWQANESEAKKKNKKHAWKHASRS